MLVQPPDPLRPVVALSDECVNTYSNVDSCFLVFEWPPLPSNVARILPASMLTPTHFDVATDR